MNLNRMKKLFITIFLTVIIFAVYSDSYAQKSLRENFPSWSYNGDFLSAVDVNENSTRIYEVIEWSRKLNEIDLIESDQMFGGARNEIIYQFVWANRKNIFAYYHDNQIYVSGIKGYSGNYQLMDSKGILEKEIEGVIDLRFSPDDKYVVFVAKGVIYYQEIKLEEDKRILKVERVGHLGIIIKGERIHRFTFNPSNPSEMLILEEKNNKRGLYILDIVYRKHGSRKEQLRINSARGDITYKMPTYAPGGNVIVLFEANNAKNKTDAVFYSVHRSNPLPELREIPNTRIEDVVVPAINQPPISLNGRFMVFAANKNYGDKAGRGLLYFVDTKNKFQSYPFYINEVNKKFIFDRNISNVNGVELRYNKNPELAFSPNSSLLACQVVYNVGSYGSSDIVLVDYTENSQLKSGGIGYSGFSLRRVADREFKRDIEIRITNTRYNTQWDGLLIGGEKASPDRRGNYILKVNSMDDFAKVYGRQKVVPELNQTDVFPTYQLAESEIVIPKYPSSEPLKLLAREIPLKKLSFRVISEESREYLSDAEVTVSIKYDKRNGPLRYNRSRGNFSGDYRIPDDSVIIVEVKSKEEQKYLNNQDTIKVGKWDMQKDIHVKSKTFHIKFIVSLPQQTHNIKGLKLDSTKIKGIEHRKNLKQTSRSITFEADLKYVGGDKRTISYNDNMFKAEKKFDITDEKVRLETVFKRGTITRRPIILKNKDYRILSIGEDMRVELSQKILQDNDFDYPTWAKYVFALEDGQISDKAEGIVINNEILKSFHMPEYGKMPKKTMKLKKFKLPLVPDNEKSTRAYFLIDNNGHLIGMGTRKEAPAELLSLIKDQANISEMIVYRDGEKVERYYVTPEDELVEIENDDYMVVKVTFSLGGKIRNFDETPFLKKIRQKTLILGKEIDLSSISFDSHNREITAHLVVLKEYLWRDLPLLYMKGIRKRFLTISTKANGGDDYYVRLWKPTFGIGDLRSRLLQGMIKDLKRIAIRINITFSENGARKEQAVFNLSKVSVESKKLKSVKNKGKVLFYDGLW